MLKKFSLDKDVFCVNCGVRTGLITRERTIDGKCLCLNCQYALPSFFVGKYADMSSEEFKALYAYMVTESAALSKKFKKNHKFSHLKLDTVNGILCYKQKNTEAIYLKLDNISYFNLEFYEGATENVGAVKMMLECTYPEIYVSTVLSETEVGSECYEFLGHFDSAKAYHGKTNTQEETYQRINGESEQYYQQTVETPPEVSVEVQKALALFMFDSLEDITAESLKKQRNRLIKSFHPDMGNEDDTKYAQKINEAYMLLLENIK